MACSRSFARVVLVFVLALSFISEPASAQYGGEEDPGAGIEVVVSANRIKTPRKKVASSVTVLDAEQIELKDQESVQEVLQGVAGVDVVQSGGAGGNSAIFMRGANSEHTLVLVDGIEVNDPITPTRTFNFANLDPNNIERIEVLRGAQSTLYGSDALGGVISITTKRGQGPAQAWGSFEGGSYSSFRERAQLSGSKDNFSYSLGAARQDVHGFSSAAQKDGNKEADPYENSSFSARFAADISSDLSSDLVLRYIDSLTALDNFGGAFGDDPNRELDDQQFYGRYALNSSFFEDKLQQTWGISYTDHRYDDDNLPDADHPGESLVSSYASDTLKFDLQNNLKINQSLGLIFGLETEQEEGSSELFSDGPFGPFESNFDDRSARSNGYYAQVQLTPGEVFFSTLGVRLDDHSQFGNEVTYRVAPGLNFESSGTRFISSIGTGYKAPSLYQLYSQYGSEDLEAEESLSIDAGIEQSLLDDKLLLGATYFWNDFDNLITFEPDTFLFRNIAEARSNGIELFSQLQVCENMSANLSYTLTDTEDKSTGEDLLRRPRHKFAASLLAKPAENLRVNLDLTYTGLRDDNDFSSFPASRHELAGYTLVNLAAYYDLTQKVQLFARVENLLDQEYEQVLGFGTAGLSAFGGFKVSL